MAFASAWVFNALALTYARMFVSASRLLCYDPLLMSMSMSSKFPERGPVRSSDRKRFLLSLSVKQVNPTAQFQ